MTISEKKMLSRRHLEIKLVLASLILVVIQCAAAAAEDQPNMFVKRTPKANLYYSKECQPEIMRYCPRASKTELSDMAVLQCIHNQVADFSAISKDCHNVRAINIRDSLNWAISV